MEEVTGNSEKLEDGCMVEASGGSQKCELINIIVIWIRELHQSYAIHDVANGSLPIRRSLVQHTEENLDTVMELGRVAARCGIRFGADETGWNIGCEPSFSTLEGNFCKVALDIEQLGPVK